MPALTVGNLLAWSIQVAAIVLLAGAAIRAAGLQSPRAKLACFRVVLVACLVLPFVQPMVAPLPAAGVVTRGSDVSRLGAGRVDPAARAAALNVEVTPATASSETSPRQRMPRWVGLAVILVLAVGTSVRLIWLAVGLLALRRLRRGSAGLKSCATGATVEQHFGPANTCDGAIVEQDFSPAIARAIDLAGGARADILSSSMVKHPVTFGLIRPVVLLPDSFASLDETEQVTVVCHELLHVRRGDWLHIVAEECLRGLLWFHPAIWWLLAQIDLSREQLVDQEVVTLTLRRQPYLNALVTLAMTPAGSILRPASLILGRAHLLQRVALLSREVRMSRPRLCLSLVLITAALVVGGRFVVQAVPLVQTSPAPVVASPPPAPSPAVTAPVAPAGPVAPAQPAAIAAASSAAVEAARTQVPVPARPPTPPPAVYKAEPVISPVRADQQALDRIVILRTTIEGVVVTDAQAVSGDESLVQPALDAVRSWQFEPRAGETIAPVTTMSGFNFARGQLSGPARAPIRIGGSIPQPVRIRNYAPVYPADAQANHIQGVVILEMTIDGAGIPIDAYALRPIESLTAAAIDAALRWRYTPQPDLPRRIMTVTVNFTLQDSGPVVGGVPSGVQGGVAGGVAGGVTGGIVGGIAGAPPPPPPPPGVSGDWPRPVTSFGPPPSEWPKAVRSDGGDFKPPTRLVDVKAVYPAIAASARVQGVVIVEVLIGTDGKIQAGRILRSIPLLDQAALEAVRQWEFTVTQLNGVAVPVVMTTTVNFTLQ